MKLVAGIMPTRSRQTMAEQALQCFLDQTHDHKLLVIVDDADDPSFPTPPSEKAVVYCRLQQRQGIAAKRNVACEIATGCDYVCHIDSDDYSAPHRISDQVERLETSGLSVTAYNSMLFLVEPSGQWLKYRGAKNYGLGTSLMYTREWWQAHRFFDNPARLIREDNEMIYAADHAKQLITADCGELMFARVHEGNSSKKNFGPEYTRVECPASFAVFA